MLELRGFVPVKRLNWDKYNNARQCVPLVAGKGKRVVGEVFAAVPAHSDDGESGYYIKARLFNVAYSIGIVGLDDVAEIQIVDAAGFAIGG